MDNDNLDDLKAQYELPVTKKKSSKGRAILLAALVVIISAGLAVGGLVLFKGKTSDTATAPGATTVAGPKPSDIIDKIAADSTVNDAKGYTLFRASSGSTDVISDTSSVIFPHSGYSYITNIAPEDGLKFSLASDGTSNKTAMTAVIQKALATASYVETKQDTSALSAYKITTYVNGGTVCQLVDYANAAELTGFEQSILCASSASLQASYANVTAQLNKADPAVAGTAKVVTQSTVMNGTKKLLTLSVQANGSSNTTNYYFATLDTSYGYIGKRATPSVDNADSYNLSDEFKKNISDAKWGTFLTDNIK
ncbi:MAG: hypothetical protein JWO99_349 [Candidatus Saccharibacteria bacterium]|nr:hypothetical protein [Candidatus Saccharibacteria bacterium]